MLFLCQSNGFLCDCSSFTENKFRIFVLYRPEERYILFERDIGKAVVASYFSGGWRQPDGVGRFADRQCADVGTLQTADPPPFARRLKSVKIAYVNNARDLDNFAFFRFIWCAGYPDLAG